jgi:glucose/arabinose dehydrogenase
VRVIAFAVCLLLAAVGCGQPAGTPRPSATNPAPSAIGSAPSVPASGSGAPAGSPAAAFDPTRVSVAFKRVVEGLASPLAVVHAGDGSGRLFVAQQGGQIRIVRDGQLVDQPFLDIADRITNGGERGLLGVAFHPRFPDDPRLFVDYTDESGDTRVSSFRVDPASPDRVDAATEQRLLFVEQPYANHNGGAVAFGPDGYLYISLGDGGSGGDPHGNGQSLRTLLGKILRIDIDASSGDRAYGIPADNPYVDATGGRQPEIWLTGLRNPWRISFDRANGDLWIGDVGQNAWEEIDVQRATAPAGTNFGWNRLEGSHCFRPSEGCAEPGLVPPVAEYGHDEGCTVIGGNVARGPAQPALAGGYLFADFCSGRVWAIDASRDGAREPTLVAETSRSVSAFGEDEAGDLFAVDLGAGELLRVTATLR